MVAATADTEPQIYSTWALRLAALQHLAAPAVAEDPQASAAAAIDALWTLFDAAYQQANATLEAMGEPGRIGLTREASTRTYHAVGPDGSTRAITVSTLLQVVDSQIRGGAYIATDGARLCVNLVPSVGRSRERWRVAATGQPFTDALVHDLFLSVFGDDPAASLRLSPLASNDIFEDIWI